jgi:hypothetical protein
VINKHLFDGRCRKEDYLAIDADVEEPQATEFDDVRILGNDSVELQKLGGAAENDLGR